MKHQGRRRIVSLLAGAAVLILSGCSRHRTLVETAEPETASAPRSSTAVIKETNGKTTAQLLQGKFAGVDVYEVPGGGIKVRMRSTGRRGEGDPLYVVDGMEVIPPDGVLYIDPNNIAMIEVERVSSLYGIRGMNGIIKITMKKK